ncbi:NAD-dependent epimerase/dehydratase family protein [Vibrio splendidus]|uniref:NAD-dependent epimerase/dehydratase family protein n=1 Tax=Vibrio splendidus TaxID=29497 RepID=UPI0015E65276|nr:NAD-dependent epimerase/dehydratase family protein [Vibrio splendidus]
MKVLLLGGTGAIGKYLVDELLIRGFEVFVTTRKERKSEKDNLVFLKGNAKSLSFTEELVRQHRFDVIVDFMVYNNYEFKPLVSLLLESTPHYVFLSTYRVFCDAGLERLNEKSSRLADNVDLKVLLGEDDYAISKAIQENFIKESKFISWTIVRPTMSYSPGRLQLGSLEADFFIPRMLKGLPIAFPKELLDKKTTLTWAGDVAKLIASLPTMDDSLGQIFLLATRETVSWRQVIKIYNSQFDSKIKIVDMADYLEFENNSNKLKFDRSFNRVCDNSKILMFMKNKNISFLPTKYGIDMTLRDTLSSNSDVNTLNRVNGKMDRLLDIWQLPGSDLINYVKYLSGRLKFIDGLINRYKGKNFI